MKTVDEVDSRRIGGRAQLPVEVADYVRDRIISGELVPGQFLRMEPIAKAVGVSITPVREGLVALSNEGFIKAVPRRGFVVAAFTREDVRDLFWAQGQFAGELAARAAQRITPDELARLGEVQQACVAAVAAGDVAEIGRLGPKFHRLINLAAQSERLAMLLGNIVNHLPSQFYASLEAHGDQSALAHADIFAAISRRDTRAARQLTAKHFAEGADVVLEMLGERGHFAGVDSR